MTDEALDDLAAKMAATLGIDAWQAKNSLKVLCLQRKPFDRDGLRQALIAYNEKCRQEYVKGLLPFAQRGAERGILL